ncbi:MAG: biopolymer transporter ExbD [Wenzhouxiangella sp.]|nr:MAG: biopolymer transporter ExbD [Wenzhouxiangella sp.]
MRLQDQEHEEPEINLTSLIDVVFLLLIFFMVSTTFDRQSLLRLDLPEAATAESEIVPDLIEIVITADGELFVGDHLVIDALRSAVRAALAERLADQPDAAVVIRADAEAPHRLVVLALDSAAAEGVRRVGIAALEDGGERP